MLITAARVRELLDYNPETGEFAWTEAGLANRDLQGRRGRPRIINKGKLWLNVGGYNVVWLDKRFYKLHRLAWLHACGRWPRGQIDHINLMKTDNRLENLRESTGAQNCANRALRNNNSTGKTGVDFFKATGKYRAMIMKERRRFFLGYFDTKEEAAAVYAEAAKEMYGEFARV